MFDYTLFYKTPLNVPDLGSQVWDIFVSAFNLSERVKAVHSAVMATHKVWIIHHEYQLSEADIPESSFRSLSEREDEFIIDFIAFLSTRCGPLSGQRLCIDVTGFMRPHLLFLIRLLKMRGVTRFDILYAEPGHYTSLDRTQFASELVSEVRQVASYEGFSNSVYDNDLLIVAAGYEDGLTAEVAEDKERARKALIFGLPSLQADMYQQNVLRSHQASDALGDVVHRVFAPASDPFVTATVLSELVAREEGKKPLTNLYLSPLSTKPQALGFALFYIRECEGRAASIIYPFSKTYSPDTSSRIGRIWKYEIDMDW
ncbi:hypothetical protein GCM10007874_26600 [Labrys miyagiensis]|uniref:Uncharacterized protein n=1 Tax=Labrys miyagiensis TaxID=346912 RepID=A0ABQ6CIU8_9HYPH|nr:hypothetical protein [Labrys miyagiensis]GLS19643.1 hypothetical protein GCM10007874_26600 [Labrys miyagiensis]